eukprot:gene11779-23170_t
MADLSRPPPRDLQAPMCDHHPWDCPWVPEPLRALRSYGDEVTPVTGEVPRGPGWVVGLMEKCCTNCTADTRVHLYELPRASADRNTQRGTVLDLGWGPLHEEYRQFGRQPYVLVHTDDGFTGWYHCYCVRPMSWVAHPKDQCRRVGCEWWHMRASSTSVVRRDPPAARRPPPRPPLTPVPRRPPAPRPPAPSLARSQLDIWIEEGGPGDSDGSDYEPVPRPVRRPPRPPTATPPPRPRARSPVAKKQRRGNSEEEEEEDVLPTASRLWEEVLDTASDKYYYRHTGTGYVQWEKPSIVRAAELRAIGAACIAAVLITLAHLVGGCGMGLQPGVPGEAHEEVEEEVEEVEEEAMEEEEKQVAWDPRALRIPVGNPVVLIFDKNNHAARRLLRLEEEPTATTVTVECSAL